MDALRARLLDEPPPPPEEVRAALERIADLALALWDRRSDGSVP